MKWLKEALVELGVKLFEYIFSGKKQQDALGSGKFEEKLKDKIKKDGW